MAQTQNNRQGGNRPPAKKPVKRQRKPAPPAERPVRRGKTTDERIRSLHTVVLINIAITVLALVIAVVSLGVAISACSSNGSGGGTAGGGGGVPGGNIDDNAGDNPDTTPAAAAARLERYLSRADFEELFPRRFGSQGWHDWPANAGRQEEEYYSYDNLKEAMRRIANIKVRLEQREGITWGLGRVSVYNKTTGVWTTIVTDVDFSASWNAQRPIITQEVDFGSFLAVGSQNDRRRELAAFLANIAHETTGGWPTAPGGRFAWGLFFNEEVGFAGATASPYVRPDNPNFPPAPGRSYHGRGPIQLSWNCNYGLFSAIFFDGDISVLLDNPHTVVECGVLGFMTALAFWMMPQGRPSCHQIMTRTWQPTAADIAAGRGNLGFGLTIMVINGGIERNLTIADGRIYSRVGFYRMIAARTGADIAGEQLDTAGMSPWG